MPQRRRFSIFRRRKGKNSRLSLFVAPRISAAALEQERSPSPSPVPLSAPPVLSSFQKTVPHKETTPPSSPNTSRPRFHSLTKLFTPTPKIPTLVTPRPNSHVFSRSLSRMSRCASSLVHPPSSPHNFHEEVHEKFDWGVPEHFDEPLDFPLEHPTIGRFDTLDSDLDMCLPFNDGSSSIQNSTTEEGEDLSYLSYLQTWSGPNARPICSDQSFILRIMQPRLVQQSSAELCENPWRQGCGEEFSEEEEEEIDPGMQGWLAAPGTDCVVLDPSYFRKPPSKERASSTPSPSPSES